MLSKCFIIVIVSLTFYLVNAQYFELGNCPSNVNVIPDFNLEKYLGLWYEYSKYPAIFESDGKCITAEYTQLADGKVGVKNSMIKMQTGKVSDIVGYAESVENAKLKVTFSVSQRFNASSNYWVLNTDYNSYSVVYSCQALNKMQHITFVWILTRERVPSANTVELAKQVLIKNGISLAPLEQAIQTDCD